MLLGFGIYLVSVSIAGWIMWSIIGLEFLPERFISNRLKQLCQRFAMYRACHILWEKIFFTSFFGASLSGKRDGELGKDIPYKCPHCTAELPFLPSTHEGLLLGLAMPIFLYFDDKIQSKLAYYRWIFFAIFIWVYRPYGY